jgi:hypothetical protein
VKSPVAGSDDVFPVTHRIDRCGEWSDASITPEQAERRELTRQFAVALIVAGFEFSSTWEAAAKLAAAEPQIQRENEQ